MKNKKQLPLIPINIENNKDNYELKESKENTNNNNDKRYNMILKQKSLNQNFIKNKLSSPNVFQKRKTDISFKNKNNIFPLKNNFIKNIPLFKKEEIITNKKEHLLSNNSNNYDMNLDSDIYQFSSVIPTITTKKDEFEISEEDKMFDQFSLEKKKKIKKIKIKSKPKIKIKKKKIKLFNSFEAPLKKVYKKIPQIIKKIESTKKLKNSFSLLKYQNLLFDIGSKTLDWNLKAKLNKGFNNLRNINNKKYELLRQSVRDIENQEKEIIDRVNKQQDLYKKNMKENNYYCMTIGMNFYNLQSLKFHRTLTTFKYKQNGAL